MKYSIWNFINADFRIAVDLDQKLKHKIRIKIKDRINEISKKLDIKPARLYEYFIWQNSTIPLLTLYDLSKLLNISLSEIERNIILCKQKNAPKFNSINEPKLPIEVSPYLTSIIANLFFDGSVPKDGKGAYYNQKNKEIMEDFIKKLKQVFGNVQYSVKKDHRNILKCRTPRIVGEMCRTIYSVEDFGTFNARIPKKIFNLDKKHQLAFILTALLDEGSIAYDGSIIFGVSNIEMMRDFKFLCNRLDIKTSPIKPHKQLGHYYVYILSIEKLHSMISKFCKEHPLISLRHKSYRLKKALEIKKQKFFYTKKFADKRKRRIIKELKFKPQTINNLAEKLLINPRSLRRYMYQFIKEKTILRKKEGSEFVYFLV